MGAQTEAFLTDALFQPIQLGKLELANRMAMAPLTRSRADDDRCRPTWWSSTTASVPASA